MVLKDILGNDFGVGDRVIFSRPSHGSGFYSAKHCLGRGKVMRISKTRVSVKLDKEFADNDGRLMGTVVLTHDARHFLKLEKNVVFDYDQ